MKKKKWVFIRSNVIVDEELTLKEVKQAIRKNVWFHKRGLMILSRFASRLDAGTLKPTDSFDDYDASSFYETEDKVLSIWLEKEEHHE